MRATSATQPIRISTPPPLPLFMLAILLGFVLFCGLLVAAIIGYDVYHVGQIYPGVSIAGIDVSGLSAEAAAGRIAEHLTFPETGTIVFQDGSKVWVAKPSEVGMHLDPQSTAMAAYRLGRAGNPLSRLLAKLEAWYVGKDVAPLLVYDERQAMRYLESIAAQTDIPTIEATLAVRGVDVVVRPGQIGRQIDVHATLEALEDQLRLQRDGVIPLVIVETPPVVLDVDEQAEIARRILSAPLTLSIPEAAEGDPGPWTVDPARLAEMLTIEQVTTPEGAEYRVGLDAENLRGFLEELAPSLARSSSEPRFIFNEETRQFEVLEPAVIGRSLDVNATIHAVNEQLYAGEHDIALALELHQPAVATDAKPEDLGITGLVSEQTTYYYGSGAARIQNIKTAASRFHGVLVAPGQTFSMAEVLGDVSLDTGYAEALIIYGDRTIEGVGGGVCQVSTTLFRTVFFGGFPVTERYSHAYRVSYYEQNANGQSNPDFAGLDATVFVPVVDFKFVNDTPYWILMETYPTNTSLTWKFYSTSDGRQVEWDTTGLQNIEQPPDPVYNENPELGRGEIKQVDWEVAGADVTIHRTVLKNGEVHFKDTFSTHYVPWRAVYEYGPGTRIRDRNNDDG